MANNDAGELRRSAVVTSYGPGSLVDMRADGGYGGPIAGCAAGLDEWDESAPLSSSEVKGQIITEPRLCAKLNVRRFRLSPVVVGTKASESLVIRRFPEWLQCPMCDLIQKASAWANDPGKASRYCASCTQKQPSMKQVFVAPVRFATACEVGHLDEFPWHYWVRHKADCANSKYGALSLRSEGAGLGGLWISCGVCKARRSLDGAFNRAALVGQTCRGKRPWLREDDASCSCTGADGNYRVVQRGASNLYYAIHESALDIPPWTDSLEVALGDYWDDLRHCDTDEDRLTLIRVTPGIQQICEREGMSSDQMDAHVKRRVEQLEKVDSVDLRIDEYHVFSDLRNHTHGEFEAHPREVEPQLVPFLSHVVRVPRLREVRALTGFTRISPPVEGSPDKIAPLSVQPRDWLPAVEIKGEGIFIGFNMTRLKDWEKRPDVLSRLHSLKTTWQDEWESRGGEGIAPQRVSPRFMLVHTFAHAVIGQLTLECGYSAAALRERLYVDDVHHDMAGALIYTGTPDSEGTLGGLEMRGRQSLLEMTVQSAITGLVWCSADPLCSSGTMAAPESHSLASCHSCVLLPETSCEQHNRFLDRSLLVGTDDEPTLGFFRELVH